MMINVVILCISAVMSGLTLADNKEIRLLGLQPMTGEAWPGGWACLVPVRMALERINADTRLLKGYNLTYDYIDHEVCYTLTSQCKTFSLCDYFM